MCVCVSECVCVYLWRVGCISAFKEGGKCKLGFGDFWRGV